MGREGRDYWEAQLSEYWDSGLTIQEYSELKERPHIGKYCYGKTPMQTFLDSLPLAKEKMLQYSSSIPNQKEI